MTENPEQTKEDNSVENGAALAGYVVDASVGSNYGVFEQILRTDYPSVKQPRPLQKSSVSHRRGLNA